MSKILRFNVVQCATLSYNTNIKVRRYYMYLKVCPAYKGKIYLSYVQGYRDENEKLKQKTIEKIGYLTDLEKIYDDPVNYFRKLIKDKTEEEINKLIIDNLKSQKIDKNSVTKNLGYFVLKRIYKELGISNLLKEKQKDLKINFQLNDV